jgi:hypothetical protein
LKGQGLNPKDYKLWSLLAPNSSEQTVYQSFDTPNGEIETFIKNLTGIKNKKGNKKK